MENKTPARTRTLAFLVSGLVDCLFGGLLLLAWLGLLPLDIGLSHSATGLLGGVLTISGVVVTAWQASKLKEPDE